MPGKIKITMSTFVALKEKKKKNQSVNEDVFCLLKWKLQACAWLGTSRTGGGDATGQCETNDRGGGGNKLERQTPLDNRHKIRMRCSWRAKLWQPDSGVWQQCDFDVIIVQPHQLIPTLSCRLATARIDNRDLETFSLLAWPGLSKSAG